MGKNSLNGNGSDTGESVGRKVLLIPGLWAGDSSLVLWKSFLKSHGHRVRSSSIFSNIDCSEKTLSNLGKILEDFYGDDGEKVFLVGHSRGGLLARALGARYPALVEAVVTVGSPLVNSFESACFPLQLSLLGLGLAGVARVPGVARFSCLSDSGCCADYYRDLEGELSVPLYSMFSRHDGVVTWENCVAPDSIPLEVSASHLGMLASREVMGNLLEILDQEQS